MTKYFKLSAERMRAICGIEEARIFPVVGIENNTVGCKGFDAFVTLDSGDGWFKGAYVGKLEMFAARGEFVTEADYLVQCDADAPATWNKTRDELGFVHTLQTGAPGYFVKVEKSQAGDYFITAQHEGNGLPDGPVEYRKDLRAAKRYAETLVSSGKWRDLLDGFKPDAAPRVSLAKPEAPECVCILVDVPQESNADVMARAVAFVRDIRLTREYLAAHDGEPARVDAARKLAGVPLCDIDPMAGNCCETCGAALESGQNGDCDECQEDAPEFINHYKCYRCAHSWADQWTAQCDDDCPECGARHVSPFKSEDA